MKTCVWYALLLVLPTALLADLPITIAVNPGAGTLAISPYIYGTNQDLPGVAVPGSRRIGGDRLTGYNWETNASNAGTDYINNSDNFMVSGLAASQQSVPAIALTDFHDQSLAYGTPYTVVTLQMAGYVAADESGPVTAAQAAPSSRWNQVVNDKPGGVYLNPPNLTDGFVYMDELLNLLVTKYGPASGKTGIRGYNLDNEPSLWPSTHPYLHPAQATCAEETTKSVALAKTIKRMDPSAEVLGPVLYGSEAYMTFQGGGAEFDGIPLVHRLLPPADEPGVRFGGNAAPGRPGPAPLQRREHRGPRRGDIDHGPDRLHRHGDRHGPSPGTPGPLGPVLC